MPCNAFNRRGFPCQGKVFGDWKYCGNHSQLYGETATTSSTDQIPKCSIDHCVFNMTTKQILETGESFADDETMTSLFTKIIHDPNRMQRHIAATAETWKTVADAELKRLTGDKTARDDSENSADSDSTVIYGSSINEPSIYEQSVESEVPVVLDQDYEVVADEKMSVTACHALTKAGLPCKAKPLSNGYCYVHRSYGQ